MKEQVKKGSACEDKLFLEAEKFGFDIRSRNPEETTIKFSFFDEPESILETTSLENNGDKTTTTVASTVVSPAIIVIDDQSSLENKLSNCLNISKVEEGEIRLDRVISIASRFKRER